MDWSLWTACHSNYACQSEDGCNSNQAANFLYAGSFDNISLYEQKLYKSIIYVFVTLLVTLKRLVPNACKSDHYD